ncbi:MAG: hypothetical protein LBT06_17205 [Hungatella sp.]|jgi:hypothetical protein|nr:hypothetical protein [Hungatella sp.]
MAKTAAAGYVPLLLDNAVLVCQYGGLIRIVEVPQIGAGNTAVTVNDWLRLYNSPTISSSGRTVDPHPDANKYDWGMKEGQEHINKWAKDYLESKGITVVENIGIKGELTDGEGRYWVAVGPNVMNPNHKLGESVTIAEMKYGTKIDIVVKDEQENLFYIPAVVGDVKEHTWPDGLYQTGKVFPTGILSAGNDDGSTVEFMGKTREGTDNYKLVEIIVYDK